MKKVFLLGLAVGFMASLLFVQGKAIADTLTIKGDIIDNMCASSQKVEELAEFINTHKKECAISPACEASGYSIYSEGALTKFDQESNAKVAEFLKKEDSKLQVEVNANKAGEELSLVSLENQK